MSESIHHSNRPDPIDHRTTPTDASDAAAGVAAVLPAFAAAVGSGRAALRSASIRSASLRCARPDPTNVLSPPALAGPLDSPPEQARPAGESPPVGSLPAIDSADGAAIEPGDEVPLPRRRGTGR